MFVYTIGDILALVFFLLSIASITIFCLIQWFKQSRCKHDEGVNETRACDAICRKCGKNLGFIGNIRDKK
jgi:TRAP-type mannitol/chloroaromatic compound transport system permease small subunit